MTPRLTYVNLLNMVRGQEIERPTGNTKVLFVVKNKSGGAGMGEYPASVFVVLQNGEVLASDDWSRDHRVVHGPIEGETPR